MEMSKPCIFVVVFRLKLSSEIDQNFRNIQRVSCYSSVVRLQFSCEVLLLLFHNSLYSNLIFFFFGTTKIAGPDIC